MFQWISAAVSMEIKKEMRLIQTVWDLEDKDSVTHMCMHI